jgi:alginate lyase
VPRSLLGGWEGSKEGLSGNSMPFRRRASPVIAVSAPDGDGFAHRSGMDGAWNAEFDSAGPTFVIRAMTPSAFTGRSMRPLLALIALACAARLRAQEYPGLEPFITAVPGQPDVAVEAGAEAALLTRIATIVDKPQPSPTGDARDYVSYARYYWPNPDTPNHLPFVRRDGHSNEEQVALGDEPRLMKMDETVGELAIGWAVYHREAYARRAGEWLRAWFVDPATAMHPNLERGQIALGHDDNRGRGEGILDAREFIGLVDALRMLHGAPGLPPADEAAIRAWFGEYLHWLLTSKIGNAEHAAANNHGSWFLAQAIAIARYVGRDDVARGLANEDFARIAGQIQPDGRQPLELARADSLTYSTFNLTAQFLVARLSAGLGVDLYHYSAPNGASLARAVDYLRPYNQDLSKWQGSQVRKIEPGFLDQILADEALLATARR